MSKEYYFAVYVKDGVATIDHENEVNYGEGNVWNPATMEWEFSHEDENFEAFEEATEILSKILQGK